MNNKSDTNLIREYCKKHQNEIFDVCLMSNLFRDIPLSNFRKYVSRLVEEGVLTPLSKGVYYIGTNPSDNIDLAIEKCYLQPFQGRPIKETLLYELGIIEDEPKMKTFLIHWGLGNKKVLNYQLVDTHNFELVYGNKKLRLLDLIACEKMISEDDYPKFTIELMKLAKDYDDSKDGGDYTVEYPQWVYLRLANLLDAMHISNRVKQDYDNKTENSNRSK